MNRPVIIAMDFENRLEAERFLTSFSGESLFLKVGMELFYKEGPSLVRDWKREGHRIFLDLKLHDIPNTVKRAARQLATFGVDMTTVHAAGGVKMMAAAMEGLKEGTTTGDLPICVAVTQLTSTSEEMMKEELYIAHSLEDTVVHYANNAKRAGLHGVVCSALEAGHIKEQVSPSFYTVTPGIRLQSDSHDDQQRVVTPVKAKSLGSDAIVVGRSITTADDPKAAYEKIKTEWRGKE